MELLETMDATIPMATAVRLRLRLDDLEHLTPELLDRFAAGSATPLEGRVVVRHLARCPSCSRRLALLLPLEHLQEPEASYDEAFDRSLDRTFEVLKLRRQERPDTAREVGGVLSWVKQDIHADRDPFLEWP